MKYFVNDECIGCGLCEGTCPEVFSMTDESTAAAVNGDIADDLLESAAQAKEECPAGAIEEKE